MIEAEDVRIFIKGLTLSVNALNFDEQFITFPATFSDLGKMIKVSNTDSANLERPCGKLRDFIKMPAYIGSKQHEYIRYTEKLGVRKRKSKVTELSDPPPKTRKCDRVLNLTVDESDEEIDFDDQVVNEAIGRLNTFFEKDNLLKLEKVLDKSRDEAELKIGLGIHMISKLAVEASTNTRNTNYKCPCGCGECLNGNDKMWIGSKHTWYGELDIVAGNPSTGDAVAVMIGKDLQTYNKEKDDNNDDYDNDDYDNDEKEENEEEISELEGRPDDRTNVELKFSDYSQGINQLVSQAIIFAFTEYNRHREKGKCIPSILIDRNSFRFVIYNPVDDQLVASNLITYRKKEFNPKSLFRPIIILWLVLNHRIFFARSPEAMQFYLKSRFQEKMLNLQSFQDLCDYSKSVVPKSKCKCDSYDDSINAVDLQTYEWFMKKL